jgi:hypothetical protein
LVTFWVGSWENPPFTTWTSWNNWLSIYLVT